MDSQLIAAIRTDYETKPISELLSIWESNNQDEYSLEAFEAVKQLLISQNQSPLPSQKEFIKKHKAHFSQAQINQIIKKAMVTLFIWGAINIVSWFINVGDIVITHFTGIKPWLWIALFAPLVIGIVMLGLGFIGLLLRRSLILLFSGLSLLLVGLWNLTATVITVPALAQYNISVTLDTLAQNAGPLDFVGYILGIAQLYWGCSQLLKYGNIRRQEQDSVQQ